MCGITCAIALKGYCKPSERDRERLTQAIDQSLDYIKHRGPDSKGFWISEHCRVALGHNRLAIVDLSPDAEQPFHDSENQIHAVVNGELYGFEAIREDLISKGHRFQSHCDSEIAIALYKEYGISFLSHLRGEFVLCLYDSRAQLVIAANDRYAIKPLFYTIVDGRLLLASEAKAFLPFGWQPEWDVQSIKEVGWLCDQRTMFQGVQKLLPGHYMTCTSFNTISQHRYWDIDYRDKQAVDVRTEQEMVVEVRKRLLDAVRDRLRADVPIGIFLSGGIDSSAIAGIIKHLKDTEGAHLGTAPKTDLINCFSIKFLDNDFDEEPVARRTSEWLGVKKHTVEMTEEMFAAHFEDCMYHNEVATRDLNTVGKYCLSALTQSKNIKVVLTGEGSDEHFAGYKELLTDFIREPDPSWSRTTLDEQTRLRIFNSLEGSEDSGPLEPPSASFARKQVNNISFLGYTQTSALPDNLFASWTASEFGSADPRSTAVTHTISGLTREHIAHKWHPLHSALYIWSKSALPNGLLTVLGDRVEMAHSVEGRQPFLDHRLTEYVMGLPPSLKFKYDAATRTFSEKWILKEAVKPFVTEELYTRKKHPFAAPVRYKVDGPIRKLFDRLITRENVEGLGFLAWEECKDLVKKGIEQGDRTAYGQMVLVGQFVTLGKRFGVKQAVPEFF
ncbi:unnamed protein product [Periconia digitata]|uniref:Glutamine amidotransferase type-2 domain-containing protein n=1 Tax=Periconia digitata TaxID=1303443 RepID=A0A9W4U749_9PLEO|nr:unnamed protein product [Periconia digitata]